jgi:hypothetical protein
MNMKIAFVTNHSPDYAGLAHLTLPSRKKYCSKHGYHLHIQKTPLSNRGLNWDKLILISKALEVYDVVVWNGADVVFMNLDFKIESLLDEFQESSIILSTDVYGINSDNMIFRKSVWTEQFLFAVSTVGYALYRYHPWAEQEAIIRFASSPPYLGKIGYAPQNKMNSYLNDLYGRPTSWPGHYQKGDWLLHLPGIPNEKRIEVIKNRLSQESDAS